MHCKCPFQKSGKDCDEGESDLNHRLVVLLDQI